MGSRKRSIFWLTTQFLLIASVIAFSPLLPRKQAQVLSPFNTEQLIHKKKYQRLSQSKDFLIFGVNERTRNLLCMGIIDRVNSFFSGRSQDFVPLQSVETYGPPVILLFAFPDGISNDEINDILSDGAPKAWSSPGGIRVKRITGSCNEWLDSSVLDVLDRVMNEDFGVTSDPLIDISGNIVRSEETAPPVIYYSGLSTDEMMATYQILAEEAFKETGGQAQAACAMAVQPYDTSGQTSLSLHILFLF